MNPTKCYRELRKIDAAKFHDDIKTSVLFTAPSEDPSCIVSQYEQVLSELLDRHAPLKTRTMSLRPNAPWYTEDLRAAKRLKRCHERKWRKSKLEIDRQIFVDQCQIYTRKLEKAKCDYHRNKIAECDDRQLFRFVDKMCRPETASSRVLPSHDNAKSLANKFADFFHAKIKNLRQDIDSSVHNSPSVDIHDSCCSSFRSFSAVTEDTVAKTITGSAAKSCPLDPIPSVILKQCLEAVLPTITRLVNTSLLTGEMPSGLKVARVIPLLKKSSLDQEELKNYRPISNLKFLFKTIERIASSQLHAYLDKNKLHSPMQSAYRKFHSTETALLRVQNDLLRAVDKHQEAVLILIDYSAAFDTIDHKILIRRLCQRYGITDTALKWFSSYVQGRTQCIDINGTLSDEYPLDEGVPQGSWVGCLRSDALLPQKFDNFAK
ncbi:uncharacterized protein [Amphiura filiformis]|uniref:uncharacterized protein n=1 Tax=Amphiura filiformis TaxID=82378 RepID=UPI003B214A8F